MYVLCIYILYKYNMQATKCSNFSVADIDNVQSSYPKTLSFRPNQNLTLPCNTPDSIPTAEVVWYKETSEITSNERIGIAQDNSLVFSHCLDDDAGQWKCKVKNSLLSNEKESNSYLLQRKIIHNLFL